MYTLPHLIQDFETSCRTRGCKLRFGGVGDRHVFNIGAPFLYQGYTVIPGRVEHQKDETMTETIFFFEKNRVWFPADGLPTRPWQDYRIYLMPNGELVGIGVETFFKIKRRGAKPALAWRSIIEQGERLEDLSLLCVGPEGMKNIGVVSINGRVGITTRPQDKEGSSVGFSVVDSLDDICLQVILEAKTIFRFPKGEWGGVIPIPLSNGLTGLPGHHACREKGKRPYCAEFRFFSPISMKTTSPKILAVRKNWPRGKARKRGLGAIFYLGGITRNEDKDFVIPECLPELKEDEAILWGGLNDLEAGYIIIQDPVVKLNEEEERFVEEETALLRMA